MNLKLDSVEVLKLLQSLDDKDIRKLLYEECSKCYGKGTISRHCGCCPDDNCSECDGTQVSPTPSTFGFAILEFIKVHK